MTRTTHVTAHTRGHTYKDAAMKRDNYATYAREASIDNIDKAKKHSIHQSQKRNSKNL